MHHHSPRPENAMQSPNTTQAAFHKLMPDQQFGLGQLMDVYRRVHHSRSQQHYERAEVLFMIALRQSGVSPDSAMGREILLDLEEQAAIWDRYTKANVSSGDFAFTMMYRIYWRLTSDALSAEDRKLLLDQRNALNDIMDSLPSRLINEFGVPSELRGRVLISCQQAMAQYKSSITSPFLRPCQSPMSEGDFDELKSVMEKEILRMGNNLSKKLEDDRANWLRDVDKRGTEGTQRPQDFGAYALDIQMSTCEQYITFIYGMAIRKFYMPRFAALTKSQQVFTLGLPDTYGVHYNMSNGLLFWAFPKDKWQKSTAAASTMPDSSR